MRTTLFGLLALAAPLLCPPAGAQAPPASSSQVPREWKEPGTQWRLHVKQYSRSYLTASSNPKITEEAQKLKVQDEFDVTVTVLEPGAAGGATGNTAGNAAGSAACARLLFSAAKDAPEQYRAMDYILELSLDSGRVEQVLPVAGELRASVVLAAAGAERGLFTNLMGFPVDWILQQQDFAGFARNAAAPPETPGIQSLDLTVDGTQVPFHKTIRPADAGLVLAELEIRPGQPQASPLRVEQAWAAGEAWWRSFRRYRDGRLDLEASLVPLAPR